MAKIYPENLDIFKSDGEKETFNFVKKNLPHEYIGYFNYRLNGQEFDLAILVPGRGVVIIEIKGYQSSNIYGAIDNDNIKLLNGEKLKSPLKQADGYRYAFVNEISKKFGNKYIPIVPMVCYPFVNKKSFYDKCLNIVSEECETILEDDFNEAGSFWSKIEVILERTKKRLNISNVTNRDLKQIRFLFEVIREDTKKIENIEYYSILKYIGTDCEYEKEIDELISFWFKGTKILLLSESDKVFNLTREKIKEKIKKLYVGGIDQFDIDKNPNSIFNFYLYQLPGAIKKPLTIIDGDINIVNQREKILTRIDEVTSFNLNQYKIEHAPIEADIMIKAGAGTGKTYSMISRINYLIYKHNLDEESLKESIMLITFTNEAAKNMKKRLQENLKNKYFITKDFNTLQMVECVENMNICTIHSLTKKILQKFSVKLGLGNDLQVSTGIYEMNNAIDGSTENNLRNNTNMQTNKLLNEVRLYDIKNRVNKLLEKLANKNIDIVNDSLDFGYLNECSKEKEDLVNMILDIAKESENVAKEKSSQNNSVKLNDLMMKLKILLNSHKKDLEAESHCLKYLFVDEYQDTDDIQIDLMKQFQYVLGFNFFVVGDIKQCIYRFRGAEDKAFTILQNGREKFNEYSLNKNYRSDKVLLEEFHQIFKLWNDKYESLEYKVNDKENDRLVGVKTFNNKAPLIERIDINDDEEIEKNLIDQLTYYKKNLSNKSTIAILVRENAEIDKIKRMTNKTEYSDIYVETDIGGDLYKITPTLDMYKLVLALVYNQDPKYLYNLYTTSYTNKNIPKADIYNYRNRKSELVQMFNSKYSVENWNEYISRLKTEPIMKVIRDIILQIKPWNNYALEVENKEEQKRRAIYYKTNLDQIIEKVVKSYNNDYLTINKLQQFLRIMIITKQNEESRDTYPYINEENNKESRILCMTVHKSKGLEFDVVIMPYCDKNIEDPKKKGYVDIITRKNKIGYYISIPKATSFNKNKSGNYDLEVIQNNYYIEERKTEVEDRKKEETRILYVAMTRSIQKFIYFNNGETKHMSWERLIKGD